MLADPKRNTENDGRKLNMIGGFQTNSRFAVWYLTNVRGLKIAYRAMQPKYIALGFVVYASTWVVVPS